MTTNQIFIGQSAVQNHEYGSVIPNQKSRNTKTSLSASDKAVSTIIQKKMEKSKVKIVDVKLDCKRLQPLENTPLKKCQIATKKPLGWHKPLPNRAVSNIDFSPSQLLETPISAPLEKQEKLKQRKSFFIPEGPIEESGMMFKKNNKIERKQTIDLQPSATHLNPKKVEIKQKETPLSPEPLFFRVDLQTIKSKLSYLTKIPNMSFFDKNNAEGELSACIQLFPTQYKDIENILTETQSQLSENRLHRLYDILCLALPKNTNATFLSLYFNHTAGADDFAKAAVSKLVKEKTNNEMIELLSLYTKVDLGLQMDNCDILFRNNWLSSSLCHEYALVIWKKEIDCLCGMIADELNVNGHHLCLSKSEIEKRLKLTDPNFSALNKAQGKKLSQVLSRNEAQFTQFLRTLIPAIHGMTVPPQLSNLFKMRRQMISIFLAPKFAEGKDLKDLSRVYTSELVFLRLINPAILSIPNQDCASVKISITKMIQSLANEACPDKDMLAKILKPIYDEFISSHRKFLDNHSL